MTDDEKLIAETAICRRNMKTFEEIHDDVAHALNRSRGEVVRVLDELVRQFVIVRRGVPSINRAADPFVATENVTARYEKGDRWPRDTEGT